MAFTSWAALRAAIKDALADYVTGSPCTGSYTIGGKTHTYRSVDELKRLLEITYEMEALESGGDYTQRVSFGQFMGGK